MVRRAAWLMVLAACGAKAPPKLEVLDVAWIDRGGCWPVLQIGGGFDRVGWIEAAIRAPTGQPRTYTGGVELSDQRHTFALEIGGPDAHRLESIRAVPLDRSSAWAVEQAVAAPPPPAPPAPYLAAEPVDPALQRAASGRWYAGLGDSHGEGIVSADGHLVIRVKACRVERASSPDAETQLTREPDGSDTIVVDVDLGPRLAALRPDSMPPLRIALALEHVGGLRSTPVLEVMLRVETLAQAMLARGAITPDPTADGLVFLVDGEQIGSFGASQWSDVAWFVNATCGTRWNVDAVSVRDPSKHVTGTLRTPRDCPDPALDKSDLRAWTLEKRLPQPR